MRTLRSADLTTGGIIILTGALALAASRSIKVIAGESLDPRTLPTMVAAAMLVCGAGILFNGWRYRGKDMPVQWPDRAGRRRLIVTAFLLLAYVILIEPIGFPIMTGVYVAAQSWYLGRYRPWMAIAGGAATGIVIYYVFMNFLELTFPLGLLEYL